MNSVRLYRPFRASASGYPYPGRRQCSQSSHCLAPWADIFCTLRGGKADSLALCHSLPPFPCHSLPSSCTSLGPQSVFNPQFSTLTPQNQTSKSKNKHQTSPHPPSTAFLCSCNSAMTSPLCRSSTERNLSRTVSRSGRVASSSRSRPKPARRPSVTQPFGPVSVMSND